MPDRKRKWAKLSKAWLRSPVFKILLATFLFGFIAVSGTFLYFYTQYSRVIDRKLSGEVFKNTAKIYAAPHHIYAGQKLTVEMVVASLQKAGFDMSGKSTSSDGIYEINGNRITIKPAVGDQLRLDFQKGVISRIVKPGEGDVDEAWLPAELVTNLFDESREKRRIVQFNEVPKNLVNALIAAEDRRFYSHHGIDPIRLVGAVVAAIRKSDRVEGTSTITQQLARNFFRAEVGFKGEADRSPLRKAREAFMSVLLEQRLTKQQILTMYANEVYLGNRGSFSIHGFGEGAATYFGKDIGELTLPEAAMLASIIPSPNAYSPSKYPDRAKNRRNIVLNGMHDLKMISDQEFENARKSEVKVAPIKVDATDAPYLVDFIRERLEKDYSEDALINDNLKVYTTLDPTLQRAAVDAVEKGLKEALDRIAQRNKGKKNVDKGADPQAALIAIDPHTGEIKAMVGGSNYGASQYNRITQAFRQPGSIFKPFVFAAALETAFREAPSANPETTSAEPAPARTEIPLTADAAPAPADPSFTETHHDGVITPITRIIDEPTTFYYDGGRTYEPNNYHQQYRGLVTVREALQHSLNVPTIRIAEQVGFERVAAMARRAGMNAKVKGYPSVALGAFEVTPLEMAGAYTIFANEGKWVEPHALIRVSSVDGKVSKKYTYEPKEVIRPELAYVMTNIMQGVISNGTGVGVRSRGFSVPAAGKTGTSRDGWFAGYTKDLLVIAWVGYDDNRDLNLEGAHSALPIWTDFMMKAYQLYPARDEERMYFGAPGGVEFVRIDRESLAPANGSCPDTFEEVFIEGSAPGESCPLHGSVISETFETGVNAIGTGVKETGTAVGKAVKGIGKFFGGIFGKEKEEEEQRPRNKPQAQSRPFP
jgi:penicillin-binding protein 1B